MTKFELAKGHYIRNYDSMNWVLAYKITTNGSTKKTEYIEGYYSTLRHAYNSAVELLCLKSKDLEELQKILLEIEKVKITIQKYDN